MHSPVTVITDKVMRMIRSMVYLAMRVSYRGGATTGDIGGYLRDWAPDSAGMYHDGLVERALGELQTAGMVTRAGARWYPVGLAH